MIEIFWISLGAILGANLRYFVSRFSLKYLTPIFPFGTLIVNVTGSFLIGFFMAWTIERVLIDPRWRLLIVVGFCGSYTTFSSFSYETMGLIEQGEYLFACYNFLLNNILCIAAVIAGIALARVI